LRLATESGDREKFRADGETVRARGLAGEVDRLTETLAREREFAGRETQRANKVGGDLKGERTKRKEAEGKVEKLTTKLTDAQEEAKTAADSLREERRLRENAEQRATVADQRAAAAGEKARKAESRAGSAKSTSSAPKDEIDGLLATLGITGDAAAAFKGLSEDQQMRCIVEIQIGDAGNLGMNLNDLGRRNEAAHRLKSMIVPQNIPDLIQKI
jgi:chromosome segregation ATPase